MAADVVGIHFGDVAEQVASGVVGIFAYGPGLPPEALEAALCLQFGEGGVFFRTQLAQQHHGLVAYAAHIASVFLEALAYVETVHPEVAAERERVELSYGLGRHHQIVAELVAYQHLSVAVAYDSPVRVYGHPDRGLVAGRIAGALVGHLYAEELHDKCGRRYAKADQQLVFTLQ